MEKKIKQRDGFLGEKLISLPETVWKKAIKENPVMANLYITHIGYFPKANYHHRERKNGCTDNILIYCLRGKGWYKINDQRFEVGVNDFFIIPVTKEELSYGAHENDPWTIYWVHFSGNDMNSFNEGFNIGLYDGPQQIIYNEKGIELWHSMYQNLEMGYSKENITKANLCLYYFISSFLYPDQNLNEKKQEEKDLISNTIAFMRTKLTEKLTLEDLAIPHQLSTSHFAALFRKGTGMSPLDYFIHLKLQKACLLLLTTDNRVKDIASDLGYEDHYYFSRLFKKYINTSPLQYRSTSSTKTS
jgi:AraC-like DNA-binding protein